MPIEAFTLERGSIQRMKRSAASAFRNAGHATSPGLLFAAPIPRYFVTPVSIIENNSLIAAANAIGWRSFLIDKSDDAVAAVDFIVIDGEIEFASLASAHTARRQTEALAAAERAVAGSEATIVLLTTGQLGFSAVAAEIGNRVLVVPISAPKSSGLERLAVYDEHEAARLLRPIATHYQRQPPR